ncbi:hypothetical protein IMG5_159600 [Ichthyophthirius multifiliis]|uniref:Histone acetyltransferase n=1 Tax=Ichthyophthirius multifiliis TaxID=5932 RepID=G0QZS8_ICHMU|nr:hypothetical protein IMG5_159600 [Ichthyophthirius multifiliis]EGR29266.1 hypothetical protein IMG5_159600 [Ichthyophthirius multifiliis]|eukprot:XP_004030502.1 hypothetical protein IMG5_159600 [Ichthyophthirius multifiliis]
MEILEKSVNILDSLKQKYIHQFPNIIISCGDTPSFSVCENLNSKIDECRPGNFILYDVMQTVLGSCNATDIAICVGCPIVLHKYPPSPSTERAHPLCIDIHIPTNRILYCTCNIIVIRDLQNPTKHVRVFSEHKSITKAARFSPNGRLVCSGGVIEGVLEHYGSKITSIQFSHNNKYLLCGDSQYKIRLWDLQNQKSLTENLVFHTAMIFSLKFSENDNFFISSSLDNRAIVWNTNSFEKILDLEFIHKGGINCAIFGLDKKSIYTCGGDGLINAFISEQNLFD